MIRSLSLSLSLFHLSATLPLEFPMPPRYPLAGNVELQLYFRQLVCVLLGNFLYNLNSSSGLGWAHPLCPLKWLSICQDLRLPSMPLDGFVFANNLGHIVREQVPTMGHDLVLAVISQAVRNCCSLLVTCCTQQHWFPHSGQFNIYSPVFVFSSNSFFLFLALTSQVSAQWSFCQDLVLII